MSAENAFDHDSPRYEASTGASLARYFISLFIIGLGIATVGELVEDERIIKSGLFLAALPIIVYVPGSIIKVFTKG